MIFFEYAEESRTEYIGGGEFVVGSEGSDLFSQVLELIFVGNDNKFSFHHNS